MAEGVKMTNWIETIVFLPGMAELGRVSGSVYAPVYGPQASVHPHVQVFVPAQALDFRT
jgi:hypothetical protein